MGTWMGGTKERPAQFFDGPDDFRAWLAENHDTSPGLWLGWFKKHVGSPALTHPEAVREALAYGWIDSVVQRVDDACTRVRFTPRKPDSVWSPTNVRTVEDLIRQGRMQPAGLAAWTQRDSDPQIAQATEWAYREKWPELYAAQLSASPEAARFWNHTPGSYRQQCIYWVLSGHRAATRERRMNEVMAACAEHRVVTPMRNLPTPAWLRRLGG